jgi:hypothetical protein
MINSYHNLRMARRSNKRKIEETTPEWDIPLAEYDASMSLMRIMNFFGNHTIMRAMYAEGKAKTTDPMALDKIAGRRVTMKEKYDQELRRKVMKMTVYDEKTKKLVPWKWPKSTETLMFSSSRQVTTHWQCVFFVKGQSWADYACSYNLNTQVQGSHGLCMGYSGMAFIGEHHQLQAGQFEENALKVLKEMWRRRNTWELFTCPRGPTTGKEVIDDFKFLATCSPRKLRIILEALASGAEVRGFNSEDMKYPTDEEMQDADFLALTI